MRCALSCLLHPLCVVVGTGAHVPLYNSVEVSFLLFNSRAHSLRARAGYVRAQPLFTSPVLPLFFLLLITSHTIALHRIAHHSSFSRLQFIKIYNDLLPGFSLSLTSTTWHWQRAKGNGGTHPSSALRRDATLGILLVFDLCI